MEWHKLTAKQRALCREAMKEERESIAGHLQQLGGLRYVEQNPADLLRIIAADVRRGAHARWDKQKGPRG